MSRPTGCCYSVHLSSRSFSYGLPVPGPTEEDPFFIPMKSVSEAESIVLSSAVPADVLPVPLSEACGRILRANIYADRDSPAGNCSAMDGVAVLYECWAQGQRAFPLRGLQRAGQALLTCVPSGEACEIMTGALLPPGCDTVVPVEQIVIEGGKAVIGDDAVLKQGQFVRVQGKNYRQGDLLLRQGVVLKPAEIALAASAGKLSVSVNNLPVIAVVSTGDEVVDAGNPAQPFQVRQANLPAVGAALKAGGFPSSIMAHVRDDESALREQLKDILHRADIVIISGGVSMGQFDYVPQVLQDLGVEALFHKVAQRPGKPFWFGTGPGKKWVFGLPGNPVSTLVCLYRYVLPFLFLSAGRTPPEPEYLFLAENYSNKIYLTFFLPVRCQANENRENLSYVIPFNGSDDLTALVSSVGFVEIAPRQTVAALQTPLRLFRWD